MSFNVSKFKSSFERMGGPARANLFEVTRSTNSEIPVNPFFGINEFKYFCTGITFPGIAVNTASVDYIGQLTKLYPTGVTNPGPVTAKFLVDSDHNVLTFFHNWMRAVVNFSKTDGAAAEFKEKLPHEVGFKDDYCCDLIIKHFTTDSFPNSFYEATLLRAYPIEVSGLELGWAQNDSFLEIDVKFALDDFRFSGDKTGNTADRSKRGGGLLDILGDVAGFADTVRGTIKSGRPRTIQDAVNRLNRLSNSFGNLSDNI